MKGDGKTVIRGGGHLPDGPALDKILRYDAALERKFQRAIILLHQLQSRRQAATLSQMNSAERTQ